MEALRTVPMVNVLLSQEKYSDALRMIGNAVDVLAPAISGDFPSGHKYTQNESLILAKVYFIKKDYRRCIEFVLSFPGLLDQLEPIYSSAILYRMMDQLVRECNGNTEPIKIAGTSLRKYILEIIADDELDPSYIGFIAEIKEYEILKYKIKEMINKKIECEEIINIVFDMAYEEMYGLFIEIGNKMIENTKQNVKDELTAGELSDTLVHLIVEAYIHEEKIEELKDFIKLLPWERMYHTCFFIEETYHLPITLENENANFILSGDWRDEIISNFMFKNSKTSFKLIEGMSKARAPYIPFCNSIMNAGTTNDTLYRNNKGLLSGHEWTRFLDFASLGMIHQGNLNAFEILKEILPSLESNSGEPAALMALGIMNARKADKETTDYLLNWLDSKESEMVFGACLGLGLNLMESEDCTAYQKLEALLSVDNTVIQESAIYAIGMIYAGSEKESLLKFLSVLCEKSDFMRVKRACGLAAALVSAMGMKVPSHFSLTCEDPHLRGDTHFRSASLLSLGSSYVATSDLSIISQVLPLTNDHDDDVKRAAVISIALVGYEDYDITSSCLFPLAHSYNMHVRSAVALVLGLFNSGVGDADVCNLLEALLYDSEELVKQSAAIGLGFALAQMNPTLISNYKRIMDRINYMVALKSESACVRIGASLGRSLAEVGGRSAVFSLRNLSKQIEVKRVVGALLFLESWYWYPLMTSISLCILPTPIFFFDENLDETKHILTNDSKFYDYIVRIPELRRSRRGKHSKESEKDTLYEAPQGLRSGDRLTYLERMAYNLENAVIFKENEK